MATNGYHTRLTRIYRRELGDAIREYRRMSHLVQRDEKRNEFRRNRIIMYKQRIAELRLILEEHKKQKGITQWNKK